MEMVLGVYKRQYDPRFPVVCMDESPKQLIGETRCPVRASRDSLHGLTMSIGASESAAFSWLVSPSPESAW